MLQGSGSSITARPDSHVRRFAVLLAQDAVADPRWLPAGDVPFKVVS
jgi:hypothetical protein